MYIDTSEYWSAQTTPLVQNESSFQMGCIKSESSEWRVYVKHFYSNLAFILIIFDIILYINTAIVCACTYLWMQLHVRSFRLQWTVRLKAWRQWHFPKQLGMLRLQDTWLLWTSSMEAFYGFILVYFYDWIPVTIHLHCWWLQSLFFCETPAVFCGLKIFALPSICMRILTR